MCKTLSKAMCFALVMSVLLSLTVFDAKCTVIKNNVLRLHILANSDSEYDQKVKLAVRDRIILDSGHIFDSVLSYDEAVKMVKQRLPEIQSAVKDELKKQGCPLPVSLSIGKSHFDTRTYDNITLPAGDYTALRVMIGKAGGHNWWCVMFPSLCIPAVSQKDEVGKVLDSGSADIVENAQTYKPAFKIVEWYEKLRNWFK